MYNLHTAVLLKNEPGDVGEKAISSFLDSLDIPIIFTDLREAIRNAYLEENEPNVISNDPIHHLTHEVVHLPYKGNISDDGVTKIKEELLKIEDKDVVIFKSNLKACFQIEF